jgi:Fic family protein
MYIRNSDNAELVYTAAPVEQVSTLMRELTGYLTTRDDHAPTRMIRAAMAHLNLTMIHPFSDGNGRMARALQSLVLARGGILDPTFSSIEEYLGAHRLAYYDVLAEVGAGSWQPGRDALPWVRFCLKAHYTQAKTAQRKLALLGAIGEDVERELVRLNLPDRAAPAIVNAIRGEKLRNPSYRVAVGVSQLVASRDLKLLADGGVLIPAGENRGRYYEAAPYLCELTAGHVDRSPIEDPFDGSIDDPPEPTEPAIRAVN